MYVTKRLHDKKHDTSYITVNDPYNDKKETPSRAKDKQFRTNSKALFQPTKDLIAVNYLYVDRHNYFKEQSAESRKKGFGSHDARKRDEFSFQPRAQQWKELLRTEEKFNEKMLKNSPTLPTETPSRAQSRAARREEERQRWFQAKVPSTLYDIGRTGVTPFCTKCTSETFFCVHQNRKDLGEFSQQRRVGEHKTSSSTVGQFHFHDKGSRPKPLVVPTTRTRNKISPQTTTALEASRRKVAQLPVTSVTPRARRPTSIDATQFFTPTKFGRRHTMAQFYDDFHGHGK